MATRDFKRDSRGRFAGVEGRTGKKKKKLTPQEKLAMGAADELERLKADRKERDAQKAVEAAEQMVKEARREEKTLNRRGGGDADHEHVFGLKVKAQAALAKALKRVARVSR